MYYYLGHLEKCIGRKRTNMEDPYSSKYLTASRHVRDLRIIRRAFLIMGPVMATVGAIVIVAAFAIALDNASNRAQSDFAFLLAFAIVAITMGATMITLALTVVKKSLRKNEKILKMEHM